MSQAFRLKLRVWTENLVFITVHVSSSAAAILSVIFNLNNICVPDMYQCDMLEQAATEYLIVYKKSLMLRSANGSFVGGFLGL